MYWHTRAWEGPLLALADEARPPAAAHIIVKDEILLRKAHAYVDAFTAHHSRSFHFASGLLPPAKRKAVRALYAFCRLTDDIVDRHQGDTATLRAALAEWRQHSLKAAPDPDDLAAVAWAEVRSHIPLRYAEQLIEGVARDVYQTRYQSFTELATYCYGVAATVGLMSMHLVGFSGPQAVPYAIKLGLALQLSNILRDVGEDWRRGRVYLPQEELRFFGVREEHLAAGEVDDRWRDFMRFQIARNRQLYEEAMPGIALLAKDSRFAIAAAAGVYQAILHNIEKNDYDVFRHRAHVSAWSKFVLLPPFWWRARRVKAT